MKGNNSSSNGSSRGAGLAYLLLAIVLIPSLIAYFKVQDILDTAIAHRALLPMVVLIAGGLFGVILFCLMLVQVAGRERSERMAESLRRSEAAVEVEKERLCVTLNSLREGVMTCDETGRIVSINRAGEKLTGWSAAEAIGRPLDDVFHVIHKKTRERRQNPLVTKLRVGGLPGKEDSTLLIARDGTERPVADNVTPITYDSGASGGCVIVFRDITEEQRTEAEMLKESKLESVGQLAGGIAHDYNNVLTGIVGNISLARMASHSTQAMMERIDGIERAALRAKELTQQLLIFAKGGAPVKRKVQISTLLTDATRFALHGTNVNSQFTLPDHLWPVEVDEGQMRQTINNLVINAVQAMPDGGVVKVKAENVEVSAGYLNTMKGGKCVRITFTDSGHGIDPKDLPKVFDPYFSTRKDGSGLGLATAYSVIRKHGGHIDVQSKMGEGTSVQIHLPAAFESIETPIEEEVESPKLVDHGRVLVMDDEPDILMVVSGMLEIHGFEVETAKDGVEALERYRTAAENKQPFDVVIMDLTIPNGMGGKEAVLKLKAFDPNARVIVSSGYSYDPVMADFRKHGFSGVMPKPYRLSDLERVLGEVMNAEPSALDLDQEGVAAEEDTISFGKLQNKMRASEMSREI